MSCPKCEPGSAKLGRSGLAWMLLVAAVIVAFVLLANR